MKNLLRKLKLIDYLQTELEIQKTDFVNRLRNQVDDGSTSSFFEAFEAFSSSKNEYKGEVSFSGFKIKRRRRFFDMNMNMAVASGTFTQKDNRLIIHTEINSFKGAMIPFYLFLIFIYAFFIIGFIVADEVKGNAPFFVFPFILVHGLLMFSIPYFIMRRSTKRLKYELEREFYYLTK
jgi:hypothetical protein